MSILSTLSRIAHEYHDARVRYLTEREVSALPPEIQKDIGWPAADESRHGARAGLFRWVGGR
jgi:hypothetical protein